MTHLPSLTVLGGVHCCLTSELPVHEQGEQAQALLSCPEDCLAFAVPLFLHSAWAKVRRAQHGTACLLKPAAWGSPPLAS